MRSTRFAVGCLAITLVATACSDATRLPTDTAQDSISAALVRFGTAPLNLALSPDSSLAVGDTTSIQIQSNNPRQLRLLGLTLRSTDTLVARVGSRGFLRARGAGRTLIIATAGRFVDTLPLAVAGPTAPVPPTTSVPPGPAGTPTPSFGPRSFFAAPTGTAGATGRRDAPWSLAAALAQPSAIQPGDTIWLRGGTYRGDVVSRLTGTADRPIVVRQYPGERATIDGRLDVTGAYAWYWGFEVMFSDSRRVTTTPGSDPGDVPRERVTVFVTGPWTKLINLVVHDMGDGIFAGRSAQGFEMNGCIVYNNGWLGPERGHGHTVYLQNSGAAKVIRDNVLFNSFGHGIHIYGSESAALENFVIDGNTIFGSGANAEERHALGSNILLWGGAPNALRNFQITNNSLYHNEQGAAAIKANAAGALPGRDLTFSGNVVHGQPFFSEWQNYTIRNNRFAAAPEMFGGVMMSSIRLAAGQAYAAHSWDNNQYAMPNTSGSFFYTVESGRDGELATFSQWRTRTGYDRASSMQTAFGGTDVIVRRSPYEPGRAIATVWNWSRAGTATIDLGVAVPAGSVAQVRHVYAPYGAPVATIPAGQRTATVAVTDAQPPMAIGAPTRPRSTGTLFNVYVVQLAPAP